MAFPGRSSPPPPPTQGLPLGGEIKQSCQGRLHFPGVSNSRFQNSNGEAYFKITSKIRSITKLYHLYQLNEGYLCPGSSFFHIYRCLPASDRLILLSFHAVFQLCIFFFTTEHTHPKLSLHHSPYFLLSASSFKHVFFNHTCCSRSFGDGKWSRFDEQGEFWRGNVLWGEHEWWNVFACWIYHPFGCLRCGYD